jgi:hypothetical protein
MNKTIMSCYVVVFVICAIIYFSYLGYVILKFQELKRNGLQLGSLTNNGPGVEWGKYVARTRRLFKWLFYSYAMVAVTVAIILRMWRKHG